MPIHTISLKHNFSRERNIGSFVLRSPLSGLPRLGPSIWHSIIRGNLSENYIRTKMTAVEKFYTYTENTHPHPSLDYLVTNLAFDGIELRLKGFVAHLQNETAIDGIDRSYCWQTVIKFVTEILHFLAPISSAELPYKLKASVARLERMYSFLNPSRRVRPRKIRSLPTKVIEELYDLATPRNKRNPFRSTKLQMRNYIVFILLLHQGLRKGELLSLRSDALGHEFDAVEQRDRFWLNVVPPQILDVRLRQPTLKNQGSVRQIPVSHDLAKLMMAYIANWRRRCPHGFLLNSSFDRPMSVRALGSVLERLSSALSPASLKLIQEHNSKSKITPHDFRHTCAILRLKNFIDRGIEMGEAEMLMRAFFGWSRNSNMPRLYAKAYYDQRLQSVWDSDFDRRVSVIRTLSSSVVC